MEVAGEHLRLPAGNNLDILLIGMTGQGKSSVGNSILHRNRFKTRGGFRSVTRETTAEDIDGKIDGRTLTVVDTPGFSDSRPLSREGRSSLITDSITDSLIKCPLGFDAIVLVISYNRFQESVINIIKYWMHMVGEDAFLTHGVVILTFGDWFRQEHEGISLQTWWTEQSVRHKWFWDQCGERCVLFDNKTKDLVVRRQQLYDLVITIDGMRNQEKHIPIICQISSIEHSALITSRDECWEVRNFEKYFSLLKQSLEHIGFENDVMTRHRLSEQIEDDVLGIWNALTTRSNEAIYNSIKQELSTVMENVRELRKMTRDFEAIRLNTIQMIVEIRLRLREVTQNTRYWQWMRTQVREEVPGMLGVLAEAGVVVERNEYETGWSLKNGVNKVKELMMKKFIPFFKQNFHNPPKLCFGVGLMFVSFLLFYFAYYKK